MKNTLYYGDNLDILRRYIPDESVDLVYLDPPFNSNRSYNVIFREADGLAESEAQIQAFKDTWRWDIYAEAALHEIAQVAPPPVVDLMHGFVDSLGRNDLTAYLAMMAIRLVELRRVLKPEGSLFLHCDPTAGHYLKILLDRVFGKDKMINQVTWKRTSAHSDYRQGAKHMGRISDLIFWYAKGDDWTYNVQFTPHDEEYIERFYRYTEPETGRRYGLDNLAGPGGKRKGNPEYEVMGVTRYWRYSKERMEQLIAEGRVVQVKPGAVPRYKRYLDEMPGVPLQDIWTDVKPVSSMSREALGYPTQKPRALLERIVAMASNKGDVVLDPFCGCGTTIAAAQQLDRRWLGIDITHLAVSLIKNRLYDMFGEDAGFEVVGEPADVGSACALAQQDPYQFEYWALSLVQARPSGADRAKGADRGIDGVLYFRDDPKARDRKVVVQVKSGRVNVGMVRDFAHVIEREKAAAGIFITLEPPTKAMLAEAAGAGFYYSKTLNRDYPRLQILTVEELMAGQTPSLPRHFVTFKAAQRVQPDARTVDMFAAQPFGGDDLDEPIGEDNQIE